MVTPLARRRPWIVARQVAALDLLSNGRMILGVGLGSDRGGAELSTFAEEVDDRRRAAMLDEALEVVHGLLSGEVVDHHGEHYTVAGARFLPTPVQAHVPTWVGAIWPNRRPLRRAARHDGVFVIRVERPREIAELGELVREVRGDLEGFDIVVELPPGTDPGPWEAAGATWQLARFTQFGAELVDVIAVIEAGPPGSS